MNKKKKNLTNSLNKWQHYMWMTVDVSFDGAQEERAHTDKRRLAELPGGVVDRTKGAGSTIEWGIVVIRMKY